MILRVLNTYSAVARKTGSTTCNLGNGTITDNKLIDPSQNNPVIATLNVDAFNGSFVDRNSTTVTITGKRTLYNNSRQIIITTAKTIKYETYNLNFSYSYYTLFLYSQLF